MKFGRWKGLRKRRIRALIYLIFIKVNIGCLNFIKKYKLKCNI